ncbi:hypothetical protein B0H10DRAFT_535993 [Mycena sp. CBHHK59/15]|nr:hypothetical protein B0H10DRAFT_535993 [Mycena sp. CBHHK59/15]
MSVSARCLQIAEIVHMICGHFDDSDPDEDSYDIFPKSESSSALATLARTCKIFSSPALDILWCSQRNLNTLFKCLPSSLWREKDGTLVCVTAFIYNTSSRGKLYF